ncbi:MULTISPECIES: SDR family oxidoreductase [unclassified Microbacterium]|uniref:SDR family oxidoreductase n=1 Tax=unclassified Microbacterium TaxID=2609290 RepID=UPI00214AEE8B|nr:MULTISPECIES: SDR family oxidoreductase [unclassified Microbacterium]MCR2810390.1 SDR family oxidoreductase [Microbacterium sp. zg.B185]WIM18447.1 SDR family oxidoreductase [Microbacterium sp. zg-B185]
MSVRALVTGGAGFLGSHVAAALVTHPDVELVVAGDVRRPEHPLEGVVYDDCDVTRSAGLALLMQRHAINVVVHLAAIVSPGRDVEMEYRVDVDGSRHVLDACVATGVRRIVVSSSGAAYGYHADSPEWLRESDPVRGSEEFPYSRHKRLVEEMLAEARVSHPGLEQVVFRIGTILGPTVRNQITALWDGPRVLAVRGSQSPFVFVWVDDVAAAMARAATDGPPGIYNVAGDGRVTVREIAARLGKPVLTVPAGVLGFALRVGRMLHLTVHGPEQVGFLRYRPVLANDALKRDFGFTPTRTSREAFEEYLATHPGVARA